MLAELQPIGFGPFFLIEHPKDILATLVGLALLALLLYKFALPGARTQLLTRASTIETGLTQVDRQLEDIAQLRNDYANRIKAIEVEQRDRIGAAVRDADNARVDIIAEAQETARALRRRSEEEMDRERTRQRILVRRQIVQITLDAAEQAVKAQNSDSVQRQLIRDFTAQVAHHANGRAATSTIAPAHTQEFAAVVSPAAASFAPAPVAFSAVQDTPAAAASHGASVYGISTLDTAPTIAESSDLPDFDSAQSSETTFGQGDA